MRPPPPAPSSTDRSAALATFLPALVALLLYLPALANGFAYDDVVTIVDNDTLKSLGTLPSTLVQAYWPSHGVHYRPVAMLLYGLQWALGGGQPWLFHVAGILLHALVTVLVVRLALRWTTPVGAAVAGLLFAAHPVHVEVVASIFGQSETLATAAMLGLALVITADREPDRRRLYAVAALSALALACKESGLAAPAVVWVAARMRRDAESSTRRWLTASVAGVLVVLALRVVVLESLTGDRSHVLWQTTPRGPALLIALALLPRAVGLVLAPHRPRPDYVPSTRELLDPQWAMVALGLLLLAGVALLVLRHRRAPNIVTFGVLLAAATFALVSNVLVHTGVVLAERSMYGPSVGVMVLFGAGAGLAWRQRRWPIVALGAAWMGAAVPLTLGGIPIWRTTETVMAAMRERAPEGYTGWMVEAVFLDWRGDVSGAARMYEAAVSRFDRDPELYALAGENALRRGDLARASLLLDSAVALQPDHYRARTASAKLALRRGDGTHARVLLEEGLRLHPDQRAWRVLLDSLGSREQ